MDPTNTPAQQPTLPIEIPPQPEYHSPWEIIQDPKTSLEMKIEQYKLQVKTGGSGLDYLCTEDGSYVIGYIKALERLCDYASAAKLSCHFARCARDLIERERRFSERDPLFPNKTDLNLVIGVEPQTGEEWIYHRKTLTLICTKKEWQNVELPRDQGLRVMLKIKIANEEAEKMCRF